MKPIVFDLTNNQIKIISPLITQVQKAASKGKENRGAVFAQIKHNQVRAKFIDAETVNKILPILRKARL